MGQRVELPRHLIPGDELGEPAAQVDLLILIGPSGAGKSSVARELHRRGVIEICPTWTTRPRRPDELGTCLEHRFVSERDFDRLNAAGFFAACGTQPGLPYRYGLPEPRRRPMRGLPTVILRAARVADVAAGRTALVYQIAVSPDRLVNRLAIRGTERRELRSRLAAADHELADGARVSARRFCANHAVTACADAVASALAFDQIHYHPGGTG
ncbi:MAG: hypothetical protein ABI808_11275 [Pseudonocardiales bacterium]